MAAAEIGGTEARAGSARRAGGAGRRALTAAVLWVAAYIGARMGLEMATFGSWGAVAIALVPAPFAVWMIWSFIAMVRSCDELDRRIHLEALAVAFPLTLLALMVLGLLQLAVNLKMEDWSYRHLWPYVTTFYFIGMALAVRRYTK